MKIYGHDFPFSVEVYIEALEKFKKEFKLMETLESGQFDIRSLAFVARMEHMAERGNEVAFR